MQIDQSIKRVYYIGRWRKLALKKSQLAISNFNINYKTSKPKKQNSNKKSANFDLIIPCVTFICKIIQLFLTRITDELKLIRFEFAALSYLDLIELARRFQ